MEFDWSTLITAVVAAGVGILAGLYVGFRKSAAEDGVDNWKDEVVKAVEEFDAKTEQKPE